jgi:hypothetical protein
MASQRVSTEKSTQPRRPPATTPEARENQLLSLAFDLAEKQLRDGTASSQVMTQFLKLGSTRERLEQERLAMEVELLEQKKEQLASQARVEELYGEAIKAMRAYNGQEPIVEATTYEE